MHKAASIFGLAAISAAMTTPAHAGVDQVYVGVMAHNICIQNCDAANREDGPNIEVQVDFDSPDFLNFIWSPKPYLVASVNVAGDTSFVGGGLDWNWQATENWSAQAGVGYVLHDGETDLPYASGTPEAAEFSAEHVLLGSEDLFRLSLGVTRDLPGPWSAQFQVLHFSHGQILGSGRNQGVDQAGFRLAYDFGG